MVEHGALQVADNTTVEGPRDAGLCGPELPWDKSSIHCGRAVSEASGAPAGEGELSAPGSVRHHPLSGTTASTSTETGPRGTKPNF